MIRKKSIRILRKIVKRMKSLTNHTLGKDDKIQTILRYLKYHVRRRLFQKRGTRTHPFVNNIQFFERFESGIAGNIYFGLNDFEEMGFLLHFLREKDLFIDIGANCGSYTLLAAGVCKAKSISLEPVRETFGFLTDNLTLNALDASKVTSLNMGVASEEGALSFTCDTGLMNHVAQPDEQAQLAPVTTVDKLSAARIPTLLKVDVEGYEHEVLAGAERTLRSPRLKACILELNGNGIRYGRTDEETHALIVNFGFTPFQYDPKLRSMTRLASYNKLGFNTIYVRETAINFVKNRINTAASFKILGREF